MANAAACGHALAIARQNHRPRSQAVFVFQFPLENVGDNFHVAMRMRGKTIVGRDPILVNHAQRTEAHPLGIPVIVEAESMVSLEPAVIAAAAILTASNPNHGYLPITVLAITT